MHFGGVSSIDEVAIDRVVQSYLARHLSEDALSQDHVQAVAKASLERLVQINPDVQKWKKKHLTTEQCEQLQTALDQILLSSGTPWKPEIKPDLLSDRQKLIFSAIQGNIPPLQELLKNRDLFYAIWIKKPGILQEIRKLLDSLFIDMHNQLSQVSLPKAKILHMEMVIGELLALYPFSGPEDGEELHVPVHFQEGWRLISYQVERIHLTTELMGSPLVAFGLVPRDANAASPLMLFKGTTYPSDDGFGLSLLTDMNPFTSIGHYAFYIGKRKIKEWLEKHASQSQAIIYGKSLGGAQAWRTAFHFPQFVSKVMAYGMPGFSPLDLRRWNQLKKQAIHPEINMFCQKNDLVPYLGLAAAEGINYYKILGKHLRRGITAHLDMYLTHAQSLVMRLDPGEEARKWRRVGLMLFQNAAAIVVFPALIMAYGTYMAGKNVKKILKGTIRRIF